MKVTTDLTSDLVIEIDSKLKERIECVAEPADNVRMLVQDEGNKTVRIKIYINDFLFMQFSKISIDRIKVSSDWLVLS